MFNVVTEAAAAARTSA